jgi:hypothetical protein
MIYRTKSIDLFLLLDNIWRQMRITVPPLLGLNTYRILIVGIVGSKPTGGKTTICLQCDFRFIEYLLICRHGHR